jgi:hypothetical protein
MQIKGKVKTKNATIGCMASQDDCNFFIIISLDLIRARDYYASTVLLSSNTLRWAVSSALMMLIGSCETDKSRRSP